MSKSNILLGADHRGVRLKTKVVEWLEIQGYAVEDLGTHSEERCDALDYAKKMAEAFKADPAHFGILICGSGQAMAMTANRYQNIRAALCLTPEMAKTSREHNDANVLAMGADFTDETTALKCIEMFLNTKFLDGVYAKRRDKLTELGGL